MKLARYIDSFEKKQMIKKPFDVKVGQSVEVWQYVREGKKKRVQRLKGYIIAKKNSGLRSTFSLFCTGNLAGTELKMPLFSPDLIDVKLIKSHSVRKAKLYYLREASGRSLRLK